MQLPNDDPPVPEMEEQQDPLSQNLAHGDAGNHTYAARSATYYGETDHPSSEDEDEALLEKHVPSTPGMAERGNLDAENPRVRQHL